MRIRKAVITAAGRGVRMYPAADTVQKGMFPLIDRDGLAKPMIQIIAEGALDSGIEEICIVCAPDDEAQYVRQFKSLRENLLVTYKGVDWAEKQAERIDDFCKRLRFVVQEEPLGYGHAVYCAKDFVGNAPFLLLLGDHLHISDIPEDRCADQVMRLAQEEGCAVAAVQATREHLIGMYGTVKGKRVPDKPRVYEIEKILEKPSLSLAELELHTPGLRAAYYLCLFGIYVLPCSLFDTLGEMVAKADSDVNGEVQLTPALNDLARRERYLALEIKGTRYDAGSKYGFLEAQIALALAGRDTDQVLTSIVELLAEAQKKGRGKNE